MTHVLKIGRGVSAARAHEESGKSKQAAEERKPIKDALNFPEVDGLELSLLGAEGNVV